MRTGNTESLQVTQSGSRENFEFYILIFEFSFSSLMLRPKQIV